MADLHQLHWSFPHDIREILALQHLVDPKKPKDGFTERILMMNGVTAVDAFSGAVLRATVEQHLSESAESMVTIWPPDRQDVWDTAHDLLGPLPSRCKVPADTRPPVRDRQVFLPGQRIDDIDTVDILARYVKAAGPPAGLEVEEAGYLATALLILAENGLRHAAASPCGVIVCGAIDAESGAGKLVVLDLDDSVSGVAEHSELQRLLDRSRRRFGGLGQLPRLAAQRNLDVSIILAAGTAVSRIRAGGRWRHAESRFTPGFCAGVSVHPRGVRRAPYPIYQKERG